jgi:transcription elongation factor GreA
VKKVLFTEAGYKKLKIDLEELNAKRPEILSSLVRAREMGDLSENGAYKSAKFALGDIDHKIRHLKHLIENGQPVKPKNNDYVQIGHTVILTRIS